MSGNLEKRKGLFRRGHCDAMAIALGRLLPGAGLALIGGEWSGEANDEDWPEAWFEPCHAVVLLDPDVPVWLDVDGIHEGLDAADFLFSRPVEGVTLRPASEEEVTYAFATMSGASPEEIEEAGRLVADDPELARAVERARAMLSEAGHVRDGGCGRGWRPLAEIAEDALFLLSAEMDDDAVDRLAELAPAERLRHFFCHSDCDDFAIALHRVTGWPIVALPSHRLVQAPDGRLLDASGWTGPAALARRYGLRDATASGPGGEELCLGASVAVEPRQAYDPRLADAVSAIRQLPWPPFDEAWFRAMALHPVEGVDRPHPVAGEADVAPRRPSPG